MTDTTIIREKTKQAINTLDREEIELWVTFARDTHDIPEPCLPLILDHEFIWPGIILLSRDGSREVICELHDADSIRDLDIHDVYPYADSLEEAFVGRLVEHDPDKIAVNFSKANSTADGLTHGLYLQLQEYVDGTEYEGCLQSAETVIKRVRGVKSPTEMERIQEAVDGAQECLRALVDGWEPKWSERDVASFIDSQLQKRNLGHAWNPEMCPVVTAGAEADHGHGKPSDRVLPAGEVLRLDFGAEVDGYVSDMQRLYYYPREGESEPPMDLVSSFEDVRDAIAAGFEVLEPGVEGHKVDSAARELITTRGWPEFSHGFGHQVGRNVHDGGTYLGPLWERYGDAPRGVVREGEVYTLELGIETEWGYLAQEEMAQVTESGARYLTNPQIELWMLD